MLCVLVAVAVSLDWVSVCFWCSFHPAHMIFELSHETSFFKGRMSGCTCKSKSHLLESCCKLTLVSSFDLVSAELFDG